MRYADDKLPVPGLVENIAQRSTRNSMVYPDLQGSICMEFRCGVHNSIQINPCGSGYALHGITLVCTCGLYYDRYELHI